MRPAGRDAATTAAVAAGSLVAGYAVAVGTGVRALGGCVLLVGAAVAARSWRRQAGTATAVALVVAYGVAFVASHPLAGLVGAWPAVLAVAAVVGAASFAAVVRAGTRR